MTEMAEDLVSYRLTDGIARIAFNDPKRLNAVTEEIGVALHEALLRAADESRAVIVTGEGPAFCSGANLDAAVDFLSEESPDCGGQLERAFNPAVVAMRDMPQPIITSLRGAIAGVGCGLSMAGDLIICSDNAYFFFAFGKVGLVPDGGSSWLLSKAIGRVRAMQLMLLSEKLTADKALDWGLVSKVVPDDQLDDVTMDIARRLARGPKSLALTKKIAWDALESDLQSALEAERVGQRDAGLTEDFGEGVRAFLERRQPHFKGR